MKGRHAAGRFAAHPMVVTRVAMGVATGLSMTVALLGAATACHAASRLDFSRWMRAIDQRSVSVQQHLAAGREQAATDDARALQQLYADMALFFEQDHPAAEAAALSREGAQLAASIPLHLAHGQRGAAAQAARTLALACNDCHDPYKPLP